MHSMVEDREDHHDGQSHPQQVLDRPLTTVLEDGHRLIFVDLAHDVS
jgi:hypothetical protein